MTPLEREAVHRLAGAFSRLSLAAELVAQAKPGPARAALVDRMEASRRTSLQDFAAAMEALSPAPPCHDCGTSAAARSACPHCGKTVCRDCAEKPYAFCCGEQSDASSQTSSAEPLVDGVEPMISSRAAEAPATSASLRLPAAAGGGRAVSPPRKRSMAPPLARAGAPSSDEAAELARYGVRRLPAERVVPSAPARPVPGVHRTPGEFFADKPALPANRPIVPRLA